MPIIHNCWLDDEPDLCPSPCVFDDPREDVDNCCYARQLAVTGKPKTDCKYYKTVAPAPESGEIIKQLYAALDPREWSQAQSDAWHQALPDTVAAFAALRAATMDRPN
jgi:hypothetical protein